MNNNPTEIVVLCGGKGTRLAGAIPQYLPKCLAPIGMRPFLDILLEQIEKEFPGRKITLAVGHLHGAVSEFIKSRNTGNCEVYLDRHQNGTAQIAYELTMRSNSANTMFINGDTWKEDSLQAVIDHHKAKWYTPMTISMQPQTDLQRSNRSASVSDTMVTRGVFVLTQQFISRHGNLFQGRNLDESFILDVQRHIGSVKFCWQDKPFWDIGTPESLEQFRMFWKGRAGKSSSPKLRIVSAGSEEELTTQRTS